MLEIQGIKNKLNNIEAELKEFGELTVADKFFILGARTALTQAVVAINVLVENLKETRERKRSN